MIHLKLMTMVLTGVISIGLALYLERSRHSEDQINTNKYSSPRVSTSSSEQKCVCKELLSRETICELDCKHRWHVSCLFVEFCVQQKKKCPNPNCQHTVKPHEIGKIVRLYKIENPGAFKTL